MTSIDIEYRIVYNTDECQIGRYGNIYGLADIYNDIIGEVYDKMIQLSNHENINLTNGDIELDSFYVEDDKNGNHKVPHNKYDIPLLDSHSKFKV